MTQDGIESMCQDMIIDVCQQLQGGLDFSDWELITKSDKYILTITVSLDSFESNRRNDIFSFGIYIPKSIQKDEYDDYIDKILRTLKGTLLAQFGL